MKLRHAAKVLVRRKSDGKYLIVWSSEWEDNPARSHQPDLPGGIVESGETQLQGLLREMNEEVGFTVPESTLLLAYALTYDKDDLASLFELYFTEIDYDPTVVLSWEHERFAWLSADEIIELNIRQPYPMIFAHMQQTGIIT